MSVQKLLARNIGTVETTDHESVVTYPSVTMCPNRVTSPGANASMPETLTQEYLALRPIEDSIYRVTQYYQNENG